MAEPLDTRNHPNRFTPGKSDRLLGSDGKLQDKGNLSNWLTQADCPVIPPPTEKIACLLNWAEATFPSLLSPPGGPIQYFSPYTYRYYQATNAYVGVSAKDYHVYYLDPNGVMNDVGDLPRWLVKAGCQ
ncbi:MAG: hypothetical protein DM484_14985 [Candidatus Methylumidiphilus alinenensis]|uniref:Uncharacterized protein n=1 Tax=Candidatus Methylumidiphilus alinenensis TaxID=2202197 RepID=A0A2W4R2P6_9GAMM|nr:MAG: hypothetical protein DM484_14985 [Candidatus Methylumidiphilus alinenensis]